MRRDRGNRAESLSIAGASRKIKLQLVVLLVLGVFAVGASFLNPNDAFCAYPTGGKRPLNCSDLNPCLQNGILQIQVRSGADIYSVVAEHHGSVGDVKRVFDPPFDAIARQVGLDRSFTLHVPKPRERQIAQEYRFDPRIEYADFDANSCGVDPLLRGSSPRARVWSRIEFLPGWAAHDRANRPGLTTQETTELRLSSLGMGTEKQEPNEPLVEWELLLLDEEGQWRKDDGGAAGDREPRRPRLRSGPGAGALPEPSREDDAQASGRQPGEMAQAS